MKSHRGHSCSLTKYSRELGCRRVRFASRRRASNLMGGTRLYTQLFKYQRQGGRKCTGLRFDGERYLACLDTMFKISPLIRVKTDIIGERLPLGPHGVVPDHQEYAEVFYLSGAAHPAHVANSPAIPLTDRRPPWIWNATILFMRWPQQMCGAFGVLSSMRRCPTRTSSFQRITESGVTSSKPAAAKRAHRTSPHGSEAVGTARRADDNESTLLARRASTEFVSWGYSPRSICH